MINTTVILGLPEPWHNNPQLKLDQIGSINFLVGPNGSGKSRFAEALKSQLGNARILGTDRLRGMSKNEGLGFLGDNFQQGFQKNWSVNFRNAGASFGSGIDTFVILEERPDIRILVEATLSHLFGRTISLEWDSGNLIPKASLESSGSSYRIDRDECHGIKELMVLLTNLYNDEHEYLIIDEPELNLHPQFQAFFMQEARKIAGVHEPGTSKKILFLITHSPFMIDLRTFDDIKSVISFDLSHSIPKRVKTLDESAERRLTALIPRLNVHHKQLFFSDNPIFVEGILDAQLVEAIQERRNVSVTAAGSRVIDAGGCEEVNKYLEFCRAFGKQAYFLYDLDSLFAGNLRQCIRSDTEVSDFLAALGLGGDFAKYCGELDRLLTDVITLIRGAAGPHLADLREYLEKLAVNGQLKDKLLQKARVATLIKIGRSAAEASAVIPQTTITNINGRLTQIVQALCSVNIMLLPGGAIEHYLPSYNGSLFELADASKRAAVEAEVALLSGGQVADVKARYGELISCIERLPAKPPVDFDATLRRYLGDFIHEVQGLVISHPSWSAVEINEHFSKSSSGLGRLFQVGKFVRSASNKFRATVSIKEPTGKRSVQISHETNAGMRQFVLERSADMPTAQDLTASAS